MAGGGVSFLRCLTHRAFPLRTPLYTFFIDGFFPPRAHSLLSEKSMLSIKIYRSRTCSGGAVAATGNVMK